jgi:alpha-L-fucosidase 2
MDWKNGLLVQSKVYSALGGNCRVKTTQPVIVLGANSVKANGENTNPLNTVYGKPAYEKNLNAKMPDLDLKKEYLIDFKTEKGKSYTIVPLNK